MARIKIKQVTNLQSTLDAKALDNAVVKKTNNLSDLNNVTTARENLSVYSIAEVDALISGASNARSVADLEARNALTDLNVTDRVFVTNDGDEKWAMYIVTGTGIPNTGENAEWSKIADEDSLTNALSAAQIKTAYESNANTNAFTDAEKNKVGFISVSQSVNLDTMESNIASNASNISTNASNISTAQATASAAQTTANNAQTTANTALTTAQSKENEFTATVETLTGITGQAGNPIELNVSNEIKSGHHVIVTINGLEVQNTPEFGGTIVGVVLPFALEGDDVVLVHYAY